MESMVYILWVGFFAAAFAVRRKAGGAWMSAGLVGLGLPSFLKTLSSLDVLPHDLFHEVAPLLQVVSLPSVLLIVLGAIKGLRGLGKSGLRHGALLDERGVNLSTLFIPRNDTNTYSRAEVLRDRVCGQFMRSAKTRGLVVIEQKSNAHSPGVWLQLDYQLPQPEPELSLRARVAITIDRYDYHRFEHLYAISVQVGAEVVQFNNVIDIADDFVAGVHEYIAASGYRPAAPPRARELPWQLWRPANRVDRLGPDWVAVGGGLLGALLLAVPMIGVLLALAVFLALYLRKRRRRTFVLTTGKPPTEPRQLRWMDSWQATVNALGAAAVQVSDGIMTRITTSAPTDMRVGVEHIGYWGVDSRVERDQVAVRYRRAIAFVQVVPHGANLYVSWECHLNVAAWVEQTLATGIDRVSKRDVHANRVVSGAQQLNEYDLADALFLGEWIHQSVKQVLKLKMAEHQIDEEIDFTIQRESRTGALGGGEASSTPAPESSIRSRIRRVA